MDHPDPKASTHQAEPKATPSKAEAGPPDASIGGELAHDSEFVPVTTPGTSTGDPAGGAPTHPPASGSAPEKPKVYDLKMTIVGAKGVRSADMGGKSDPYCICMISGKPDSK